MYEKMHFLVDDQRKALEYAHGEIDSLKYRLKNAEEQIARIAGGMMDEALEESKSAPTLVLGNLLEMVDKDVDFRADVWRFGENLDAQELASLAAALVKK